VCASTRLAARTTAVSGMGLPPDVEECRALDRSRDRLQRPLHQPPPPRLLGWRGQVRVARRVRDAATRHDSRRADLLRNRDEVGDEGCGDTGPLQLLGKR
jgi:hypothetical protein